MLTVQVDAGAGVAVPLPLPVQQGDPTRHEEQEDAASGAGTEQEHQQLRGEPTPGVRLQALHWLLRNLYCVASGTLERWHKQFRLDSQLPFLCGDSEACRTLGHPGAVNLTIGSTA